MHPVGPEALSDDDVAVGEGYRQRADVVQILALPRLLRCHVPVLLQFARGEYRRHRLYECAHAFLPAVDQYVDESPARDIASSIGRRWSVIACALATRSARSPEFHPSAFRTCRSSSLTFA